MKILKSAVVRLISMVTAIGILLNITAGAAWISLGSNEAGENEQPAAADPVVEVNQA